MGKESSRTPGRVAIFVAKAMSKVFDILDIIDEEIDVVIIHKSVWQRTLIERDSIAREYKRLERIVASIEEGES